MMEMMHYKFNCSLCFVLLCLLGIFRLGFSAQEQVIQMRSSTTPSARPLLGGLRNYKGNPNDGEIESLGRFAVLEHNKKENALLEFARVVSAKQQVVAGMMYHLTLEVIDAGKKRMYEAKVWVKPWMSFKQLQEFKLAHEVIENYVKFELLLKVRRGIKEEKFKVILSKNIEGKFYLDHMEQDY
nr:cysteine proteinase inhibitor-like [Ipomoea batatas]